MFRRCVMVLVVLASVLTLALAVSVRQARGDVIFLSQTRSVYATAAAPGGISDTESVQASDFSEFSESVNVASYTGPSWLGPPAWCTAEATQTSFMVPGEIYLSVDSEAENFNFDSDWSHSYSTFRLEFEVTGAPLQCLVNAFNPGWMATISLDGAYIQEGETWPSLTLAPGDHILSADDTADNYYWCGPAALDLTWTVPEPSTIALLLASAACVLGYAWRCHHVG